MPRITMAMFNMALTPPFVLAGMVRFITALAALSSILSAASGLTLGSSFAGSARVVSSPESRVAPREGMTMRARVCDLTGKKPNRQAMAVSFSHKRNKKVQAVNLQNKRLWWAEGNKFVTLRISTKVRH